MVVMTEVVVVADAEVVGGVGLSVDVVVEVVVVARLLARAVVW